MLPAQAVADFLNEKVIRFEGVDEQWTDLDKLAEKLNEVLEGWLIWDFETGNEFMEILMLHNFHFNHLFVLVALHPFNDGIHQFQHWGVHHTLTVVCVFL